MRRFLTVPTAILTVVLLIAGCTSSDDTADDETTIAAPATTVAPPETATTAASTTTTSTAPTTTTTIAPTTVAESQAAMVTEKGLVYATWEVGSLTLDMHAPVESAGAPIVIYLPGRGDILPSPSLFEGLVAEGAFVFVVRYAASNSGPEQLLADDGADAGAQAESVACAINFARAQASEFGNNDPLVVLTGFSNGGGLGAHVALFGATLEARWDEYAAAGGPQRQVECKVTDGSTHVDAVVGMGSPYDVWVPIYDGKWGRDYQQEQDPELWEFLSSSIGVNPDLKIRLIHGESDYTIPYENSTEFATALTEAGYDVQFTKHDGGHTAPTELAIPTITEVLGP